MVDLTELTTSMTWRLRVKILIEKRICLFPNLSLGELFMRIKWLWPSQPKRTQWSGSQWSHYYGSDHVIVIIGTLECRKKKIALDKQGFMRKVCLLQKTLGLILWLYDWNPN